MKKLKYIKLFENFQVAAHGERTESEILNEQNLEDLCVKLNSLSRGTDSELNQMIRETIMLIQTWSDEKLGFTISNTEGNVYQDKIKIKATEEVEVKLQEILRFCSAGKYYDQVVKETIEGLLQML